MKTFEQDLEAVLGLKDGESCLVAWREEYGRGGEATRRGDYLELKEYGFMESGPNWVGDFSFDQFGATNVCKLCHAWC